MPVAGQQAVLDRAAMQRKAEVGATIINGIGPTFVPEHAHAMAADLGEQPALGLESLQRPCINTGDFRRAHARMVLPHPALNK